LYTRSPWIGMENLPSAHESVLPDNFGITLGTGARRALKSRVIHVKKPKARRKTLLPFKIVEKRPMAISLDRSAFGDRSAELRQVILDELRALGVLGIGDPVLGDEDRLAGDPFCGLFHQTVHALRVDLPTQIIHRRARVHLAHELLRAEEIHIHH